MVRLSALIRWRASGSRSGAVAVPQTGWLLPAALGEALAPCERLLAPETPLRAAPGSSSEFVDGPLTTASGSTARTAGSRRRLSASSEETVVATAFTVRYVTMRGASSCRSCATIGARSVANACARRVSAPARAVCWFRSRTMTRWSAFADSTPTCPAVR